jgi:hypothetical protein
VGGPQPHCSQQEDPGCVWGSRSLCSLVEDDQPRALEELRQLDEAAVGDEAAATEHEAATAPDGMARPDA